MKKLFEMGSLLSLEDMTTLKILGGYELVKIGEEHIVIRKEGYVIQVKGKDIQVDMMMKHSALLSFSVLYELRVDLDEKERRKDE